MKVSNRKILLFSKSPEPGKVKTRLAKVIGDEKALELYLCMLGYCIDMVTGLEYEAEIRLAGSIESYRSAFASGIPVKPQCGDDLGQRLTDAFETAFESAEQVLVIGGDCVSIDYEYMNTAFAQLEEHPVVIGPAVDGGFVLLALNKGVFQPELFQDISWGSAEVLTQLKRNLEALKIGYVLLDERWDVDEYEDLEYLKARQDFCHLI